MIEGRIAIFGWGSLIWDLDDLAPKVEGDWLIGAGPAMPMEFSRISPKRKQALAVCLDEENGAPCRTSVIASARDDIEQAIDDLAARERARSRTMIGAWMNGAPIQTRLPALAETVGVWCAHTGAAGAVWTDLEPNFEAQRGETFTIARAAAYLRGLEGESLAEAVRYLEYAPEATSTPLRTALGALPWWRELARKYAQR